ncbi:protein of unknown function [Taphrina deformans PYCC 5710]|uniref:Uncharacterized protein n=1 Tax=Taphrina deformans (strain PYCC 5710 / ATCC 11124 / CBS 356.35 / IMI 108563 / JCM 9778 / NBRC 8474) TaxID=1097556 RepID=R4XFM2_TAPDE|nr:protein of unknown function [Taphrina deformans PYCC 5710]|eukprot:CCG82147.1 protein of unknown function [Taphrina deformans PYCC 5710]
MNFELKFSSSKGEFPINVDFVAVLEKRRIPLAYYVAQESTITTTDQAAIKQLSEVLLGCPLSFAGETVLALLVQANDSRWLIYGRTEAKKKKSSDDGVEHGTLRVVARKLSELSLSGFVRPEIKAGESAFLVKRVRSALDDHQVKKRKKRRLSPIASGAESNQATDPIAKTQDLDKNNKLVETVSDRVEEDTPPVAQRQSKDKMTDNIETLSLGLTNKPLKDKLKKMIITLLSLQVCKRHPLL